VIRRLFLIFLALMVLLAAGLMTAIFIFRHPTPSEFQQATASQPVRFPRDEAAHFNTGTEWWYYTGFLEDSDGRHHAFELVFFKVYMPPDMRLGNVVPLRWINNPLYFAHLALTDLGSGEHVFFERVSFPKFWEASTQQDRFEVHLGDWQAWGGQGEHHLRASAGRYRLRLDLASRQPPVLHGPEGVGVVQMGQAGTSYYYSEPNLNGLGLLYVDGAPQAVLATAWMDHQWGSWQSHGGYAGWDWFSLRLDDGSRVMLFEFRNEDGSIQAESAGTWIEVGGESQHLEAGDSNIEVLERWTSPDTGATYPVKWHVSVPDRNLDAIVEATFPEQEMAVQFGPQYWEGSVTVSGSATGVGFVEMTGYTGAAH
jgi:predicted secreted hydrolase